MNIVIFGGGAVGGTLVEVLANPAHRITVVDDDPSRLGSLEKLDGVTTVAGNAALPSVQEKANVAAADMVIAVTGRDVVNIVAAQLAHETHDTPNVVVRLRSNEYSKMKDFMNHCLKDFVIINPEGEASAQIERLLKYPLTFEVISMANDKVTMIGFRSSSAHPPTGMSLTELKAWRPTPSSQFIAAFRKFNLLTREIDTIQRRDEVYFCAPTSEIRELLAICLGPSRPEKKILIAGAGHVGTVLTLRLQQNHTVRLLEKNPNQAEESASKLKPGTLYVGDATDVYKLRECEIFDTDVFIAVTNNDEINVMSSLLAKQEGVKQVITLLSQDPYAKLLRETSIDVAVSPQRATASSVLSVVHARGVLETHRLRAGSCEVFEAIIHGTKGQSKLSGKQISKVKLPSHAKIAALVREGEVIPLNDDVIFSDGDHVIFFVADGRDVASIIKLIELNVLSFH